MLADAAIYNVLAGDAGVGTTMTGEAMQLATDHGDPASDLPRVVRAADSYRRAGDEVRVRTGYYWCLPAVAHLIGAEYGEAIVTLHDALTERAFR